jgi:hypothetical protein
LQGAVADEILDDLLRPVEAVTTTSPVDEVRQAPIATAVHRLASAYAAAPAGVKSPEKFLVVFSLTHAALAAMHAVEAAVRPEGGRHERKAAAEEAERAVRTIHTALDNRAASAALEAARQDYEILLRVYGEHDEVVIGEPVQCFQNRAEE